MDLNGVSNSYASYAAGSVASKSDSSGKASKGETADKKTTDYGKAATYEPSGSSTSSVKSKDRSAIIAQMKADTQARMEQMQSLVTKMFNKQGITIGTADDMWKALASGNFTADAQTIANAKNDIAEDGYWGVNQTSDRIFDFAKALSGEDESKMQEMVKAVEKGFKEATKSWGKNLPDISNQTYKAVMDKFDKWFEDNGSSARTESILK